MAEKVDYKKVYPDLYLPSTKPAIIDVPTIPFIMVDGAGNPNTAEAYKQAMEILYGLSFTIKMSRMSGNQPEGYFDYVVSPLEGLWWTEDDTFDNTRPIDKERLIWTSMIRQPDFVTPDVFAWAAAQLAAKKPDLPVQKACFETLTEGLCVQILHIGPYDTEPASIAKMAAFEAENGYIGAISDRLPTGQIRRHHEIYLGDPRRTAPEKRKTVIRHPVKKL